MVLIVESKSSFNEYQNEFAPEPDRSLSRALNRMAWPGLSTPHYRHRRVRRRDENDQACADWSVI